MSDTPQGPEKINERLRPLAVPLDTVRLDPRNARKHSPRNLEAIKYSLDTFGQQKPIVVREDGVVIAGNGTYAAAKALGWTQLAAVFFDGKSPRRYALADNRTAELAEWDFEVLSSELQELDAIGEEVSPLGWVEYELTPLLKADWSPKPPTEKGLDVKQDVKPIEVTAEQREVIGRAMKLCAAQLSGPPATEGRLIELICADYLAGAEQEGE